MGTTNGFYEWKDETTFGSYSNTTGAWTWNTNGENCTINEIMYNMAQQYSSELTAAGYNVSPSWTASTSAYFKPVQIFGSDTSPSQYGGLIPLVGLYQVDYGAYYADTGAKGTGVTPAS
jgi:hypothetical protein